LDFPLKPADLMFGCLIAVGELRCVCLQRFLAVRAAHQFCWLEEGFDGCPNQNAAAVCGSALSRAVGIGLSGVFVAESISVVVWL
jgi:hypothetical protein